MMVSQSEAGPSADDSALPDSRRLRHAARDELAAAAVSLVGSLMTTLAVWALVRWLG